MQAVPRSAAQSKTRVSHKQKRCRKAVLKLFYKEFWFCFFNFYMWCYVKLSFLPGAHIGAVNISGNFQSSFRTLNSPKEGFVTSDSVFLQQKVRVAFLLFFFRPASSCSSRPLCAFTSCWFVEVCFKNVKPSNFYRRKVHSDILPSKLAAKYDGHEKENSVNSYHL